MLQIGLEEQFINCEPESLDLGGGYQRLWTCIGGRSWLMREKFERSF